MTTGAPDGHEELFVADFYPELGEHLAEQHATGYDAVVERTRFLLWLARHVDGADPPSRSRDRTRNRTRNGDTDPV
jgi:hypothetical protein